MLWYLLFFWFIYRIVAKAYGPRRGKVMFVLFMIIALAIALLKYAVLG